ncbi:MAG: LysE family transporter [candidate division WOR-3 bacterium]
MVELILKVMIISISGALAPGPLTAATASWGVKRGWKAGLEISLGHTFVEFPIVLLIGLGLMNFLKLEKFYFYLGIFGSLFLFLFGILTIKDALSYNPSAYVKEKLSFPLLTGISLSLFNPYFLIWWLGIGMPLIYEAIKKSGFIGLSILYIFHVSLDYFWLIFIATLSSFAKKKIYRYLLFILGIIIIYFGIKMLFVLF